MYVMDELTLVKANHVIGQFGHAPITEEEFRMMGVRARMSFLYREVADCCYAIEGARMAVEAQRLNQ